MRRIKGACGHMCACVHVPVCMLNDFCFHPPFMHIFAASARKNIRYHLLELFITLLLLAIGPGPVIGAVFSSDAEGV